MLLFSFVSYCCFAMDRAVSLARTDGRAENGRTPLVAGVAVARRAGRPLPGEHRLFGPDSFFYSAVASEDDSADVGSKPPMAGQPSIR